MATSALVVMLWLAPCRLGSFRVGVHGSLPEAETLGRGLVTLLQVADIPPCQSRTPCDFNFGADAPPTSLAIHDDESRRILSGGRSPAPTAVIVGNSCYKGNVGNALCHLYFGSGVGGGKLSKLYLRPRHPCLFPRISATSFLW